jgi:hypothetical protein
MSEVKHEIEQLKRRLAELEQKIDGRGFDVTPTEADIGTLVQLWSYSKDRWGSPAVLERVLSDDGVVMRAGNGVSDRARIYTGPVPIRLIPHNTGEQPVDDNTTVLVQFRELGIHVGNAGSFTWRDRDFPGDVIAYAVLDIREASNEW